MQHSFDSSTPSDISLLLRAHGEHFWLTSQVLPVLQAVEEHGELDEDDGGSALAFLEVLWLDARRRAAETDAAFREMRSGGELGAGEAPSTARAHADTNAPPDLSGPVWSGPDQDAARVRVLSRAPARAIDRASQWPFQADARRYHAAVSALRIELGRRVDRVLAAPGDHAHERAAF